MARGAGILLTLAVSAVLCSCSEPIRARCSRSWRGCRSRRFFSRSCASETFARRLRAWRRRRSDRSGSAFSRSSRCLREEQGEDGPGYVLMTIMFAWLADTAVICRTFLGRASSTKRSAPKRRSKASSALSRGAGRRAARALLVPAVIPLGDALALGLVAGTLGQLGDLGESLLKRSTGVKDSGESFPATAACSTDSTRSS